ncbi:hypothetical protein Tco_0270059 [Tanacetum coccineum]
MAAAASAAKLMLPTMDNLSVVLAWLEDGEKEKMLVRLELGCYFSKVDVYLAFALHESSLLPVVERGGLDGLGAWIGVVSEVVWGTTSNGGAGSASGMFGKMASKTKSGLFDVLVESKWN